MNISITLDTEQTAVLDDMLADFNNGKANPVTSEIYLQEVLMGCINDKVKQNFQASAKNLIEMAEAAPYEQRLALIELVQSQLA